MAVLSLDRLSKRFGARLAVDGVSFEVQEREVFGLLGPNGSGKSTILRLVTGYLSPELGDRPGRRHRRRARRRAPRGSASATCRRTRRSTGTCASPSSSPSWAGCAASRGRALDRAIDAAVERLALGSVRGVIIERLSRGYRQRVSLAQAVLHEPELLVLDEPSNGLDPRQIIELRGLLRHLAQDCAVLVTSHILAEIERTADRVGDPARRTAADRGADRPGNGRRRRCRPPSRRCSWTSRRQRPCDEPGGDAGGQGSPHAFHLADRLCGDRGVRRAERLHASPSR